MTTLAALIVSWSCTFLDSLRDSFLRISEIFPACLLSQFPRPSPSPWNRTAPLLQQLFKVLVTASKPVEYFPLFNRHYLCAITPESHDGRRPSNTSRGVSSFHLHEKWHEGLRFSYDQTWHQACPWSI